jgi:hypothetical protein
MPPQVKVKVQVHRTSVANDKFHCPIADSLRLSDPDILMPYVDRDVISFSRRSTNLRLSYLPPLKVKAYIDDCDALDKPMPGPFVLTLSDDDLISKVPRRKAVNPGRVKQGAKKSGKPRKPLGQTARFRGSIRDLT